MLSYFYILTRKTPPHQLGKGGGLIFLSIFWAVHDISRSFEFLSPKNLPGTPLGGVGKIVLGSNDSQINPHMRAKFGCSQTVVSKRGV